MNTEKQIALSVHHCSYQYTAKINSKSIIPLDQKAWVPPVPNHLILKVTLKASALSFIDHKMDNNSEQHHQPLCHPLHAGIWVLTVSSESGQRQFSLMMYLIPTPERERVCLHGQACMPMERAGGRGLANVREETYTGVWLEKR